MEPENETKIQDEAKRDTGGEEDDPPLVDGEIEETEVDEGYIIASYQIKQGKLDGKCMGYNPTGATIQDSEFGNDKLNGWTVFYDDAGKIEYKAFFIDGVPHGRMEIFENGVLTLTKNFRFGRESGVATYYYPNGSIYRTENYEAGKLHGRAETFGDDGKLLSVEHFQEGKLHGEKIDYYPSGKIQEKSRYKNGVPHGKWVSYFMNGTVRNIRKFSKGKQIGETVEYKENGARISGGKKGAGIFDVFLKMKFWKTGGFRK